MKKIALLWLVCSGWLSLLAQPHNDTIKLSQLYAAGDIPLYQPAYLVTPEASVYDTIKMSFVLVNDLGQDTSIFYTEGPNDWYRFSAASLSSGDTVFNRISGRDFYGSVTYINVYFPAQQFSLKANTSYHCLVQWKSNSYKGANMDGGLISAASYFGYNKKVNQVLYTNNTITYFFTGAIFFGSVLFLFLYYKSKYPLFGLYAAFLFLQGIYAVILFDVYTLAGKLFIAHFNWDEYVTELVVFSGQAMYVQFVIGWLKLRQVSQRLASIFNMLSLVFAVYAFSFFLLYTIAPQLHLLSFLRSGIRILALFFQLYLFYNIIFKIRTPGRWYIFTGNLLLMVLGIIMIYLRGKGVFTGTWLSSIDNARWYMLGVLGENLCFTMGMGQHYFEIQSEKNAMQIAALNARQEQLVAQEQNLKDRLRISQDLHDSIGSTLSSISVYSQVAKIHGEKNEQEDLHELLGKISATSNEMVGEMNDIVWAINPRNDSMDKIIQRMESFARPMAAARNMRFQLHADEAIHLLQMDMERRKNFYLIFKEAVNNAIKYSGATELHADLQLKDNQLVLQVSDNGVGFNPDVEIASQSTSLSGNGLRNMYSRAAGIKGILTISGLPGHGAVVTLSLPL